MIVSLLAGYFLVIGDFQWKEKSITTIPFEYSDKGSCEQAAIPAVVVGMDHVCIPTDTHTANKESD
jgi:hypothetical protein